MTSPNEALARLERVLADYPHRAAEVRARVAAATATPVAGEDPGGLVRVTATGAGELTAVRVSERALHDLDPATLADRITEAINAALARAEATLSDAAHPPAAGGDTAPAMAHFVERMDGLLDRLTRLDHEIEDRLDE